MRKYLMAIGKAMVNGILLIGCIFHINTQAFAETVFGPNVRVDDTGLSDIDQGDPSLAVDQEGNIYIAWADARNGNYDIYFANSGTSFSPNIRVNQTGNWQARHASITVDQEDNIYVVWNGEGIGRSDIYFAKSTDGGLSFGPNVRVADTGSAMIWQSYPSLAVDVDGNIYVAWGDQRSGGYSSQDIYFAKSTDGGTSFGPNVRVNDIDSSSSHQEGASVAVDIEGNVYVSWSDTRNGNYDIYFAKSIDGGLSFGPNIRVDDTGLSTSWQYDSHLAIDPTGNIYVAWDDQRNGNHDIYFAKSIDGGLSFGPNVRVDDTGAAISQQDNLSIAVGADGNINIAWTDDRNGNKDIYFAKSIDGGTSFGPNTRVDDTGSTSSDQIKPSIAVDQNGNIYIAWKDKRNSPFNYDIYFTSNTYQINMSEMPWYENIPPYFSTGAATAQMILNYIREGAGEPLLTQDEIYEYARAPQLPDGSWLTADEVDKVLGHFDPYDYLVSNDSDRFDDLPGGNPVQGYNFSVDTYDPAANPEALNEYMRDISHWMAYLVQQEYGVEGGDLVARPNTPAAIPIYGTYYHWVAVKGSATSENPTPDPDNPWFTPDFTVYGFWMKDPFVGGLGQDTYKTAAECELTYFLPLTSGDDYDGLFLQVAEPPVEMSSAKAKIRRPKRDLANLKFIGVAAKTRDYYKNGTDRIEEESLSVSSTEGNESPIKKQSWQDLVDPYLLTDSEAVAAFEGTEMAESILVGRLDKEDSNYILVPFDKPVKGKGLLTSAVIILDAQEGYFKEASWTKNPEKLLKVNGKEAIELIGRHLLNELRAELKKLPRRPSGRSFIQRRSLYRRYRKLLEYIDQAEAELVWQYGSLSPSPYLPYWKIDANGYIWYVTQKGEVTSELKLSRILDEISTNILLMDRLHNN